MIPDMVDELAKLYGLSRVQYERAWIYHYLTGKPFYPLRNKLRNHPTREEYDKKYPKKPL